MTDEWVHVKDRTPSHTRLVLVAWRRKDAPILSHLMTDRFVDGAWLSDRQHYPSSKDVTVITHWMELPAPPDGGEKVHRLTA